MSVGNAFAGSQSNFVRWCQRILGANLLEIWHSGFGVSTSSNYVTSWTGQKLGIVLQPIASQYRPFYQTDGAYFRGKPIVKFTWDTNTCLISPELSLGSPTNYLHLITILRMPVVAMTPPEPSNIEVFQRAVSLKTNTVRNPSYPTVKSEMQVYHGRGDQNLTVSACSLYFYVAPGYNGGGNNFGNRRSDFNYSAANTIPAGTAVTFLDVWVDLSIVESSLDVADRLINNPIGVITRILFGADMTNGANPPYIAQGTNAAIAGVLVLANPATEEQREALQGLALSEWGCSQTRFYPTSRFAFPGP